MNILLTGYKGFIGQNFLPELKDHNVTLYEWGETLPIIKGLDWVIHLGAISSTTAQIEQVMEQNYEFSVWLLDECLEHKVNLQWSSSASVYGMSRTFKETDTPDPRSPYAWSKYLFERYIDTHNTEDIIIQGFRYFNVYGPHEEHKGNMASPYHQFSQQAVEHNVVKVFENSENFLRDFVPVELVIDLHMKFLNETESGIFNIGTGHEKSFLTVAQEVAAIHNASIEEIPMPEKIKKNYQSYTKADMTKTNNTLTPKV